MFKTPMSISPTLPAPLHLARWIEKYRAELKPPVANRVLWPEGEFIVMVVGGPNRRSDFHLEQGPELFYQLEGDMTLQVIEGGRRRDIVIGAGEMLLLPGGVAHSPQRPAGSVGLVVERRRQAGELDHVIWFCPRCDQEIYRESFHLTDIETQFAPIFARFASHLAYRTCRHCGAVHPPP